MKADQKLTPKYWIGHSSQSDDVFLDTASKSKDGAVLLMNNKFGKGWGEAIFLTIDLIEINLVDNDG